MMSEVGPHLLIVEDEPVTRARLSSYFESEGYRVSQAGDGETMRRTLAGEDIDLLLLDINLPGEDGLTLARAVRSKSGIGIILVTGRTDDIDRIVGLEIGADDYVTKPVNMRELLARVKNLLRRTAETAKSVKDSPVRKFDDWSLNLLKRQLQKTGGDTVHLTRGEFELLTFFVSHPGVVLNRDRLTYHLTNRDWNPADRTVDVLVRRLRQKLETDPSNPLLIVTVHGEGYQFTAEVQ